MDQALDAVTAMIDDRVPRYVITANLNYAMLVASDPQMRSVTDDAAMILADGQPIVWRSWLAKPSQWLPGRVAGSDLLFRLAEKADQHGWRIYFLGAEPGVAQACADELKTRYPGMQVAGVHSPPYRELSSIEIERQLDDIRQSRADILLVAFGQPKGEKWIHQHSQQLGVPVSIQVGASFDFAAGRVQRAPRWMQRTGLEWVHRMLGDPRRLIPRYCGNLYFLVRTSIREWIAAVNRLFGV